MNRTVVISASVALLMLVPTGLATWASYGGSEPSTSFDTPFMWPSGPGTAQNHVYFNVVEVQGVAGTASVNSATLGGRTRGVGETAFNAILGVWVDCNKDGYVGLADGALLEYRAEVSAAAGFPVDLDLCPVVADTAANAGQIHNDGTWVTELIAIGPTDQASMDSNGNYRVIADSAAQIWGDFGAPVTPASAPAPSDDCADSTVNPPFGKGDTGHTGGMLQHIDCLDGNLPWHTWDLIVAQDDTGTLAGVPFKSIRDAYQNGGPADISTFGTDQSCKSGPNGEDGGAQPCQYGSNSIVYGETDCSSQPITVTDPATGTPAEGTPADPGDIVLVQSPGVPTVNPQGSIAATANETIEENPLLDDCNSSDDSGHDVYGNGITEAGTSGGTKVVGKTQAEMDFGWGGLDFRFGCDDTSFDPNGDPLPTLPVITVPGSGAQTCGMPESGGLAEPWLLLTNGMWWSGTNWIGTAPNAGSVHVDRNTPSVTPDLFQADYTTFYAQFGVSGLQTPGATAQYGAEWCTAGIGRNAGIQNGWDCDPADWNLDPQSGEKLAGWDNLGNVGDVYGLRDTDCYDTTVIAGNANYEGTSLNPTGQDIGGRTVGPATEPGHGC